MPTIKPFHGIRYSSRDELESLVCPPYDVISDEDQMKLHERHPNNAVHLELARTDEGAEKYRKVAQTFDEWLRSGVLQTEDEAALYVYRQDFRAEDGVRRRVVGVIGALELERFGRDSGVLPHERTMAGPIEDRLTLMRSCPVNISPIYAIYRGGGKLGPFFDSLEHRPASVRFSDEHGTLHRMWIITAPAELEMLSVALGKGPLVIADGHHRYETALAYHEENKDVPGEHDAVMCFCVDGDVEDVVVLPYHRALKTQASPEELIDRITETYKARSVDAQTSDRALEGSLADHPYLFLTHDSGTLVELHADDVAEVLGNEPAAWRRLDVVALHEVLLPKVLPEGVGEFSFSKDRAVIEGLIAEGWTAGVLLKALDAVQVFEVARSGARMPQKASYFWPKAITGLVFRSLAPLS
jgi:uncharacterized protein (DUF1015 family)